MRGIYKSGKKEEKIQFINGIYNLMNLSDDRMVVIINNNISALVMNKTGIKIIMRMYLKARYDTNTSEIQKFNDTLDIAKYIILIKNVHKSWCERLMEVQDSKYDVSATCELSNYFKVPILKRKIFNIVRWIIYVRFSVLSVLLTPVKLRIYNCSHRLHYESVAHSGSIIDIIISKKSSIVLHGALVHYGTPSWCVESGYSFFSIVKNDYTIINNEKTEFI